MRMRRASGMGEARLMRAARRRLPDVRMIWRPGLAMAGPWGKGVDV